MNEAKAEETWWTAYWHRDISSAAWRLSKEESSGAFLWTLHFIPLCLHECENLWWCQPGMVSLGFFNTFTTVKKLPVGNEIGSFWGKGRFHFSENVAFGTDLDDPLSSQPLRSRRQIFSQTWRPQFLSIYSSVYLRSIKHEHQHAGCWFLSNFLIFGG